MFCKQLAIFEEGSQDHPRLIAYLRLHCTGSAGYLTCARPTDRPTTDAALCTHLPLPAVTEEEERPAVCQME